MKRKAEEARARAEESAAHLVDEEALKGVRFAMAAHGTEARKGISQACPHLSTRTSPSTTREVCVGTA